MSIRLINRVRKDTKVMCQEYSAKLIELADRDRNLVALDADLATVVGMKAFQEAHPDRFFDCGIAEADMVSIAAGLSASGKIPYAHSFAPFITRRAFDQVFISGGYAKLNVKLIGSDPGATASFNGGTHMTFEDMGLMRMVPGMTVIEPTDNVMMKNIIEQVKDRYGMYYIRMLRCEPDMIYEEGSDFEIGKGVVLRDGKDVTIVASGILVAEALKAADILAGEGISARVVDMFTWKPIDGDLLEKCAEETGCFVTAENHNTVNGLYSAVSECLAERYPAPIESIGSHDRFGQVGSVDYIMKEYNMLADDIAAKARVAIRRKKRSK